MKHFRARKQKSGKVYYYFDTGQKPRKEIPLGSDYVLAVRKWSDLMAQQTVAVKVSNFAELATKYETEELPLLAKSTQATQRGDLKMLREFFCTPSPAPLDLIKPSHVHQLLQWKKANPTTANRLKRVFSRMFNLARAWGYTNAENPARGVKGFALGSRDVYVTDEVFSAIWDEANEPLRDAMDLAYLTGQRPGDLLTLTEQSIVDDRLQLKQNKTKAAIRIRIEGKLAEVLARIQARKDGHKVWCSSLLVTVHGKAMTKQTLRDAYEDARTKAAAKHPKLAEAIRAAWFYDLRAKAADDVSESDSDQAAADLLGHAGVSITKKHYIRRGKVVGPTR